MTDAPAADERAPVGPGFSTLQVQAGYVPGLAQNTAVTPIYQSNAYEFASLAAARDAFALRTLGNVYSRNANPTQLVFEERIARLEGGTAAVAVASGQAATAGAVLALAGRGQHVVAARQLYGGTIDLLQETLAELGIETTFVDQDDLGGWRDAVRPETRAFFAESISNPRNAVLDIAAVADVAHSVGAPLIIDNTLATPYLLRPIEHGADIVVHSASKFLAGHGSVLGGFIVDGGRFDWASGAFPHLSETKASDGLTHVERYGFRAFAGFLRDFAVPRFGAAPSPINAFLIEQGIETLSLRVERQSSSALRIAEFLEAQPEVEGVHYAGLSSNPYHLTAQRYLPRGSGAVFSFTLAGGEASARSFYDALRLFTKMTHLGDVRSLVIHPATTTHVLRSEDERARAGVTPGLIRLSVGIEDLPDLLADLDQAFQALRITSEPARPDVVKVA